MDYWGGGPKGMLTPTQIIGGGGGGVGGGAAPLAPTSSYAYAAGILYTCIIH